MMKKNLLVIITLVLTQLVQAQCSATPDYYDDYSTAIGWSTVDKTNHAATPNVKITGGKAVFTNLLDGREQRIVKQLPFTLNNKAWVSECKFTVTGGNAPAHMIMSFTENNNDTYYTQTGQLTECSTFSGTATNQDGLFCYLAQTNVSSVYSGCCPQNANWKMYVGYKDGTAITSGANTGISIPSVNTNYYIRMQRTDYGSGVISVFSDAAMTIHVAGSPQCFSITPGASIANLNYVQHGSNTGGNCGRKLSAQIDDLKLYNVLSPCPLALNPSFTLPTFACANQPIVANGSASTSGTSIPINDHVWIVQESDANGNSIAGAPEWWSPFIVGSPGLYTIPSVANGGPSMVCGKYYKVSLALQNCGNIWAPTFRVIYIECAPQITLTAAKQTVCTGSSTLLTAVVTTSGLPTSYTYTWSRVTPSPQVLVSNTTASTLTVTPTTTSTYQVTAVSANGCSSSQQITVTVLPTNYSLNVSTGYDNVNNTVITPSLDDDNWQAISAPYNSALGMMAICITSNGGWAYDPLSTGQWITADATGAVATWQGSVSYNPVGAGHYIYQNDFFLPSNYNYTMTISKFAADNDGSIALDGTVLTSLNPMAPGTNYTVGTTSPVTVAVNPGFHSLVGDIIQYDRYTGMFLQATVTGTCAMAFRNETIALSDVVTTPEFVLYPNPSNGLFTVESTTEQATNIEIYNTLGMLIQSHTPSSSKSTLDLTGFPRGIYLVTILTTTNTVTKTLILE